jgi:branched-chain amino acid transport system ATP-binding protein
MSETALEVSGLSAGYGAIPILESLSFHIDDGEVVGILGHNGMGKTTLLRALMGFLPATGGAVRFGGRDITTAKPHARNRQGLGYVPQGREIFDSLSVRDNLRMGCARHDVDETVAIATALETFPILEPLLQRPGGALSGGEQQLLAIARCLCARPRLVLLDEPTEGVQPSIVVEIGETLARLRAEQGLAVVLVEQNLDFVASLADRALIIQRGEFVREASREELADPAAADDFLGLS